MEEIRVSDNQKLIVTDLYVYLLCAKVCDGDYVANSFKASKGDIINEFSNIDSFVEYLQDIGEEESVDDCMAFQQGYSLKLN